MKLRLISTLCVALFTAAFAHGEGKTKTETFDRDPGWEGVNNRSARTAEPTTVREDFGYSKTHNAGGAKAGEVGGYLSQAGEVAYYAKKIDAKTFNDPLSASGTFACADGTFNMLVGFFNADTTNEWRTPNTIALRLQGRGDFFYAYVEYCTSKWRAGGDSQHFGLVDAQTGKRTMFNFKSGKAPHTWSLKYDPAGNDGNGVITATVDDKTGVCNIASTHKEDGATFNRFGIMNVMKSADKGTEVWFDDIKCNSQSESFDKDPNWEGKNNRKTWKSIIVRPRFDFGFSETQFAGGKSKGELGGQTFRGDCRYPDRMACYGDKIGPISLDKPIKASGKIAMTRGVTDSTTTFGFYSASESLRKNESQNDAIPDSCLGIDIEGPSSEGFLFYPVCRPKGGATVSTNSREFQHIHPDGASHDWSLEYNPQGAGGKGQITITFDGKSKSMDLKEGDKARGTQFDRFGIVTTWIDGNSQNVYWDDITYTVSQD